MVCKESLLGYTCGDLFLDGHQSYGLQGIAARIYYWHGVISTTCGYGLQGIAARIYSLIVTLCPPCRYGLQGIAARIYS